jgi:parvulin-like peptidyl-prolyl isomerase
MKCIRPAAVTIALLTPGLAAAHDPVPPPPTVVAREVTPPPAALKGVILERVLVRVNGEIFTQTQLEQQRTDDLSDRNVEPAKVTMAMIAEITPDILVKAVDDLLLVQRGRELGIKFSDQNFQNGLDNIKKQNNLNDAGLKEAMAQAGLTLDQLRQKFEKTYIIQAVQQQEIHLSLTEEEARQYYQSHPNDFMTTATVTLREIFIAVPTQQGPNNQPLFSVSADNDAKAKIEAARARVQKGEDFAAVAAEVSTSGSKANGGLIGQINLEQLNPSLRTTLEALKPGELSEAVRTATGYQFFKLEARSVPEREPFTKVRDRIGQRIFEERVDSETAKLLTGLRSQAVIEWKDDGYKQMYEKRLKDLATKNEKSEKSGGSY